LTADASQVTLLNKLTVDHVNASMTIFYADGMYTFQVRSKPDVEERMMMMMIDIYFNIYSTARRLQPAQSPARLQRQTSDGHWADGVG